MLLKKIKKLVTAHRKMKQLQAHRKQLWQDIMIIHHMFD